MGEPFTMTALLRADDVGNRKPSRNDSAFIALVRNEELGGIVYSMRQVEQSFNSKFQYPWIFFNNDPFTDEFKRRTASETQAACFYEQIPKEHWDVPDSVDRDTMARRMAEMLSQGVKHASDLSYHQMCRWYSGFFYKHPALDNIRYYWRVEPWIQFFCAVEYDVFQYMSDNNKVYGFTINIYDDPLTLPSLWPQTLDFIAKNPQHLSHQMAWGWLTDSTGRPEHNARANGYSTCHFWSNFEIGDLEFWRHPAYESYFQALDRTNGFFYERWGDAPVHSIALGLFANVSSIHWFRDIGYRHTVYTNCPASDRCQGCQANKFAPVAFWLNGEDCRVCISGLTLQENHFLTPPGGTMIDYLRSSWPCSESVSDP
ncbi:hypothetical protein PV08_05895 [Exophiala spinifera]|uniref:Mannosyltransferase n=1 Tax=Exophiala spinifera TaxID=91928 RepID=A0A0D2BB53_9EURO|nr:uncharacterized protein PV08_05895 [Exophiala spinifera]KIW15845.1 hypothetical protein PV08_05895 [Exophiala spinifera]